MPAVVFRVAVLAQALAAGTFEPQRRGVEKRDRNSAEQRLAMSVERLLDGLGGAAARRVDRSEPGHRLVGMVEIEPFSARHAHPRLSQWLAWRSEPEIISPCSTVR